MLISPVRYAKALGTKAMEDLDGDTVLAVSVIPLEVWGYLTSDIQIHL